MGVHCRRPTVGNDVMLRQQEPVFLRGKPQNAGADERPAPKVERTGNLGTEDGNGCESYCLIYRVAAIGSAEDCAIRICDKGLEPLQAALVYWGGRFFLENLSMTTNVTVNDRKLSSRELIPLSFGDRIRIARLDMQFIERCQLFVDS